VERLPEEIGLKAQVPAMSVEVWLTFLQKRR
jgi:hypothetical protein